MHSTLFLCLFSQAIFSISANPHLDGRIIGGTDANISYFPYQVSLQNAKRHICGASIIHPAYILTAAHCLEDENLQYLKIRAGSHFYNNGGIVKKVCSTIIHNKYRGEANSFDYDIAILKLCNNLTISAKISPITLPFFDENPKTIGLVSGWGFTNTTSNTFSQQLQKLNLELVKQNNCKQKYQLVGTITPRMFCASCKTGRCDSCQGDSGGPFVANGKLVGIVSWGYGCAHKDYPGVYTKVSKFRKWIKNIIKL